MAENNGVQHITELGFDLSKIAQDFQEIERMVLEQGVKLHDLSKNNWKLDFSTQIDKTALSGVNENLKQGAQSAQTLNERISKLSVTEKDLLRTYTQSAQVQAQIRKYNIDSSGVHSKNAAEIRSGVDEIWKSYQNTQKLNEEERERLGLLNQQLAVLKSEVSVDRSDSVVRDSGNTDQTGIMGRAGQWFGAYQMLHLSKQAAVETVSTMKEVETQMMEISRVMELTESQSDSLRTSLFGVSHDMAREFEATAEIMLRFSQAGYNVVESTKMTEQALLAMNTAELDAQNSTNSMIGILQQWGYEADQLITVIDKLNYTADNNAATTQDLVDGLLRSSSAAKNANFSFDETVGVLVALREASGRTGKELGTALNSLISFTRRAKSLEIFEGMGVQVYTDETEQNLRGLMDIWVDLSDVVKAGGNAAVDTLSKMDGMSELLTSDISKAVGMQEEYNELFAEGLSDVQKMEVFSQAGTFRQNYWIALLENMDEVSKVVGEMGNAEGHSLRENARYMETLEAKTIQLKNSLQELAVQFGEAGFIDLAKGVSDLATGFVRLTKNTGGLVPMVILLATVISNLRKQQELYNIAQSGGDVKNQVTHFQMLKNALGGLKTAYASAGGGAAGLAASATTAGAAINSMLGPIGWVMLAVQGLTGIYNAYNASIDKSIEKSKQLTEEFKSSQKAGQDNVETLGGMKEEFDSLSKGVDVLGNNVSLTADEYKRYSSMVAEILDMHPSLIKGYDKEGNAMSSNNELLSEAIRLQGDLNKVNMQDYIDTGPSLFKGIANDVKKVKKEIDSIASGGLFSSNPIEGLLGHSANTNQEFKKMLKDLNVDYSADIISYDVKIKDYTQLLDLEKQIITEARTRFGLDEEQVSLIKERIGLMRVEYQEIEVASRQAQEYLSIWASQGEGNNWYENIQQGYISDFNEGIASIAENTSLTVGEAKAAVRELGEAFSTLGATVPYTEIEELKQRLADGTITATEFKEAVGGIEERFNTASDGSERYGSSVDLVIAALVDFAVKQEAATHSTTDSVSALDEWANALSKSAEELKTLQSEISSLETAMQSLADGKGLTLDATLKLLEAYPELASAIRFVGDEWYFEADALELLRQAKYSDMMASEAANVVTQLSGNLTEVQKNKLLDLIKVLSEATTATQRQAAMTDLLGFSSGKTAQDIQALEASLTRMKLVNAEANKAITAPSTSYRGNADAIKAETAARNEKVKALQEEQKALQKAMDTEKKALQSGLKEFEKKHKTEIDLIKKKQQENEKAQKAVIESYKKQQKAAEESYKKQRKALEERYSAEIEVLRKLKEGESRSDDKEDYQKSKDDLLLERADMEKRTGREAVERIKAIDDEIAKLDEAERRRLRDNNIDDQISEIERKKEYELNAIDEIWERRQKQFESDIEKQQILMEKEKERVNLEIEAKQSLIEAEKERINLLVEGVTAVWEAQKEAAEEQMEALRQTNEASAQSGAAQLENLYTFRDGVQRTVSEAEAWFSDMYARITQHGDEWAMNQIRNNYEVLMSVESLRASLIALGQDQATARDLWRHQGSPYPGAPGYFPKSHTGSVVARDGLVNVQAGQVVVREDISQGLIRLVEIMNRSMSFAQPSSTPAFAGMPTINSPLVVIEKQVFANSSDIPRYNNDLNRMVRKILDDMVKG